ncbi:hypothetical protein CBR_g24105 [Chara braunii]|uniref:DDE Tnp4 domain-containing protein n=1 Tax=Chara braunii TaxID=69332 RepID=A0A388L5T0_CHABU|nr:hypothetical protein CBR_g24105 [Chara braunii]|eukprot:GBG77657.1 hypothetical protein CBR_g24105 [Chara braunii]
MDGGDLDVGELVPIGIYIDICSTVERTAVAAAVTAVLFRCQVERTAGGMKAQIRARRRKVMQCAAVEGPGLDTAAVCDAVVHVCCTLGCGALPRATPRWWMKRRKGGTWEDLRQCDDATKDYFRDKLRMSPRVFREIAEALSRLLQRRVTFYRETPQPDQIVAYALYRWASGETYESSTCNFGIDRASGLVAVRNVTMALLTVYRDKISWPMRVRKSVVLRAFAGKGFPNCHGCIDCSHIYIDKPTNAPDEDYYDQKRRFSIVTQVVVDLDLRVLDVFVGYPGSCHDVKIIHLSSVWVHAEAGELFMGPPVMLPFGVQTNDYLLSDNGYPPLEWIIVPYGTTTRHLSETRFDNKHPAPGVSSFENYPANPNRSRAAATTGRTARQCECTPAYPPTSTWDIDTPAVWHEPPLVHCDSKPPTPINLPTVFFYPAPSLSSRAVLSSSSSGGPVPNHSSFFAAIRDRRVASWPSVIPQSAQSGMYRGGPANVMAGFPILSVTTVDA